MSYWEQLYTALPPIAERNTWQEIYGKFYLSW